MGLKIGRLSEGNFGVLAQGAEAKIFLNKNKKEIIKQRIKKGYRIKELDNKIRRQRTKAEKKLLIKTSQVINSPIPFEKESRDKEDYNIKMPYIQGKKLSEYLDKISLNKQETICKEIGDMIAKIHEKDIIHGDLTTSNIILEEKTNKIYFIDFGLGFFSNKIEDKAVDLHLLKQALNSKHFKNAKILFQKILEGYNSYSKSKQVLERFQRVENRGRYKKAY